MEWFLKTPSWEYSELERDSETNISAVVGLTNLSGAKSNGDCSVDLQLGRLGDLNDGTTNKWKNSQGATSTSSSSCSSKRSRGTNTASQNVSCLVDGCNAELTNSREYHRRHKVCEVHAKTPTVMVRGQQQRFCQQCSRFHLLGEFDEIKRSCRKRLDGHNRRRRKPQPDALSANSAGLYPPHHQGNRFSSYQHILTTSISDPSWTVPVKSEADPIYSAGNHHLPLHFLDSHYLVSASSRDYKATGSFPFGSASVNASTTTTSPSLFNTISSADSDCALSLLSSSNRSSGINIAHMVPSNRIPVAQPLFTGLQYDSSNDNCTGHGSSNSGVISCCPCPETSNGMSTSIYSHRRMENEQVETNIFVASGGEAVVPCQEMFNVSGEDAGPIDSETSLTLPIFWHS